MGLDLHRGGFGAPLVLIHGTGHSWRGWKPMLPLLEERFDVLAVDLPGFGRSEQLPPSVEATPEALADAVEDEMARAGFDRAHIAGNSLGGWIALELARRGRAETVTAISPAGLGHAREKDWGAGILRGMRWIAQQAPPPKFLLQSAAGRVLAAGPTYARAWKKDPDQLAEEAELFASSPGFEATMPHALCAQPRGLTTLEVPVLILWGTLDLILIPRQGRRFERLIPGAELRYVRGVGHTPMSDAPEELAEAIGEFALDRPRARPTAQAAAAGS
jgi:pimeloyl-ACP methyl ester carboxylesterase